MRERNHFDGRPHRYKAYCHCSNCDVETRRRIVQFWTQTSMEGREAMMAQFKRLPCNVCGMVIQREENSGFKNNL